MSCIKKQSHCSMISAGLLMLSKNREIVYDSDNISRYTGNMAVAVINYNGHYIAYDVEDGYQYVEEIQRLLETVDFYFKRSFSYQKIKNLIKNKMESEQGAVPHMY